MGYIISKKRLFEEFYLLGYNTVQSAESQLTFQNIPQKTELFITCAVTPSTLQKAILLSSEV
jgi:hypothetical protein